MAENTPLAPAAPVGNPGQPATQTPNPAPNSSTNGDQKILGKFSSPDELAKAYQEAEKKISEYGSKYKDYDSYAQIGAPQEISQALDWARQVKAAIDRGELVPKTAVAKAAPAPSQTSAPWDSEDWALMEPSRQAAAQAQYLQNQLQGYINQIAAQYGQAIEGFRQTDGREKALLMQTLKMAMQNPGTDPEQLLTEAAQYAQKSPEELLQMVMEMKSKSPESLEKEIARRVAEQVAEKQQEWEKSRFAEVTTSRKPRFGPSAPNRETENRQILESLAKNGIRF